MSRELRQVSDESMPRVSVDRLYGIAGGIVDDGNDGN
jgi:hypothetical protein